MPSKDRAAPLRRARVYRRRSRLYFHAVSLSPQGRWVMASPLLKIEGAAEKTFLGETLLGVLASSRTGARDRDSLARRSLLELAGMDRWADFVKETLVVDVERDAAGTRLFAAARAPQRPSVAKAPPTIALAADAPAIELGAALSAAFRSVLPKGRPRVRAATGRTSAARIWSPALVVERIQERHARGLDLSTMTLIREDHPLYSAAQRLHGSWRAALSAAGLSVERTARLRRNFWSTDRVIAAIRDLHAAGRSVKAVEANEAVPGVLQAAYVYLGSWRTALQAAGIDPRSTRRSPGPAKPPGYWSAQRVIEEIKERAAQGHSLVSSRVNREAGGLAKAAFAYFDGGWAEAVERAGFDYGEIRLGRVWSKELVIAEIQERSRTDRPVTMVELLEEGLQDLVAAGSRLFGSWPATLRAAGLQAHWLRRTAATRQDAHLSTTAAEIRRLASRGHDLADAEIRQRHPALWRRAEAEHGSWDEAVRAAGLKPARRFLGKWSRRTIREAIQARLAAGRTLGRETVEHEAPALYDAAARMFGGWYRALDGLGFDARPWRQRRTLTPEAILQAIRALAAQGAWDVLRSASKRDRPLYAKASAQFGGWQNALTAAGLDPLDPRLRTRLSKP